MLTDEQVAARILCTRQQFARQRRFAAEKFFEQPTARNFLQLADLLGTVECDEVHRFLGTVASVGSYA